LGLGLGIELARVLRPHVDAVTMQLQSFQESASGFITAMVAGLVLTGLARAFRYRIKF